MSKSTVSTLRYYRSTDTGTTTSDTEVGTDSVDAQASEGIVHHRIDLTAPSPPGTYYYGSCVDAVANETDTGAPLRGRRDDGRTGRGTICASGRWRHDG